MSNPTFTVLTSIAAPLDMRNVDTDQIIPARFLRRQRSEGFKDQLFCDLRFNEEGRSRADFVLNNARYRDARILVARENFGSGSSREYAVYALWDYGIRAVIAPSFGDIFFSNAMKNGLLPIMLPHAGVEHLLQRLHRDPTATLTIDLAQQVVVEPTGERHGFEIDAFRKQLLLSGVDELGFTLDFLPQIDAFERQRAAQQPWA